MGALTFLNSVKANKNGMDAVFRQAVEQAMYDHGHAGYSGTLAEKHEVTFIKKVDSRKEAFKLASDLIDDGDPRIDNKWGPAGAIEYIDKDERYFLFFGWASS